VLVGDDSDPDLQVRLGFPFGPSGQRAGQQNPACRQAGNQFCRRALPAGQGGAGQAGSIAALLSGCFPVSNRGGFTVALPWPCGLGLRFQWSLPPHRRGCKAAAQLHPTLAVQNQPEALWLDPVSLANEPRPNNSIFIYN
jgi:hypothetical protein